MGHLPVLQAMIDNTGGLLTSRHGSATLAAGFQNHRLCVLVPAALAAVADPSVPYMPIESANFLNGVRRA